MGAAIFIAIVAFIIIRVELALDKKARTRNAAK